MKAMCNSESIAEKESHRGKTTQYLNECDLQSEAV